MSSRSDHLARYDNALELGEAGNAKAGLGPPKAPRPRTNRDASEDGKVNPSIKSVHSSELAQPDNDGNATATMQLQGGADSFGQGGQTGSLSDEHDYSDGQSGSQEAGYITTGATTESDVLSLFGESYDELRVVDFTILAKLNIRNLQIEIMKMGRQALKEPKGRPGVDLERLARSLHAYSKFSVPYSIQPTITSDTSRRNQRL